MQCRGNTFSCAFDSSRCCSFGRHISISCCAVCRQWPENMLYRHLWSLDFALFCMLAALHSLPVPRIRQEIKRHPLTESQSGDETVFQVHSFEETVASTRLRVVIQIQLARACLPLGTTCSYPGRCNQPNWPGFF